MIPSGFLNDFCYFGSFFLKTMDIERYRPLFFGGLPLIGGQVNVAIS